MCSSIVRASNGSKALMPSSIPYLQFDFTAIIRERFESKVYANGSEEYLTELIISISNDDR